MQRIDSMGVTVKRIHYKAVESMRKNWRKDAISEGK